MSYLYDDAEILKNIPVDFDYGELDITPNDHYVDAATCFIDKLEEIIYLLLKKEQDGRAHVKTAVWALALALGSKHLEGRSMTDIAEYLDVTRAAVSKQTVQFCKSLNLPASPYMSPSRKGYGKETALQKAARLAESVDYKAEGTCIVSLTKGLIDLNIDKFINGRHIPAGQCWGVIGESSIFIKSYYLELLFNGKDHHGDIVRAWSNNGIIPEHRKGERRTALKRIFGEVHRGYHVRLNKCNQIIEY